MTVTYLIICCAPASSDTCDIPKNEAGIIWDSICFAFLLLQRRVFMSYYFLHVVADIRASQVLASRCLSAHAHLPLEVKYQFVDNVGDQQNLDYEVKDKTQHDCIR